MKYLTVGTRELKKELFNMVEDTEPNSLKPRGGIWLTKYDNEHYNEWIDFMLDDPVILYYKNMNGNMWAQPCSLVTLKDNAKIYNLNSESQFQYLKTNYPLADNKFSYEEASKHYDGMLADMFGLLRDIRDDETRRRIYKFGVNSLMLFNLDCIDYYQSGTVFIEPFDYEMGLCETYNYEIKCDDVKKRILR